MRSAPKTKAKIQDLEPRRRDAKTAGAQRDPQETSPQPLVEKVLAAAPGDPSRDGGARILRSPALTRSSGAGLRALTVRRAQRRYGNRRVQRALQGGGEEREGGATPTAAAEEAIPAASPGLPMDDDTRGFMESRFRRDFGDVRIHADPAAAESAEALSAEAYTSGRDIYFARGRYTPETREGRLLLAHELTHTVQQAGAAGSVAPAAKGSGDVLVGRADDPLELEAEQAAELITGADRSPLQLAADPAAAVLRRQEEETTEFASPSEAASGASPLLVEDDQADLRAGQLRRSDFLTEVRSEVCGATEEILSPAGRSTDDCPYLEVLFTFLAGRSAAYVERTLRSFAPQLKSAATARDYVPFVVERARRATARWVSTGEISGLPEGVPATFLFSIMRSMVGTRRPAAGEVQRKAEAGTEAMTADPRAVLGRLGPGRPLEGGVRSRMESAFGADFSGVRAHTDGHAAGVSRELSARALTVGRHVAFGPGEYRPGTPAGDALIAHELAHVLQQGSDGESVQAMERGTSPDALEADADRAAAGVVESLWGQALGALAGLSDQVLPRLHSGLSLQRCGSGDSEALPPAPTTFSELAAPAGGGTGAAQQPASAATLQTPARDVTMPILGETGWEAVQSGDAALLIRGRSEAGGDRVFVLPARGFVFQAVIPASRAGGAAPQRGPAFSLPAVGHAGVLLVRTGHGTGMLIDAGGTPTGRPNVLLPASLTALRTRLGITNIQGALITHTHADHVSGLTSLVSSGNLTGNQVWVYPGWRGATSGPLGAALRELGSGRHATAGFAAGWAPQAMQTRQVTGPTGQQVTRARLVVGDATLEMVTNTTQLRRFNQALQAGQWQRATRYADAASMLTRVSVGENRMLHFGDMRGRDLGRLQRTMGDQAFRDFVGGARVVSGFHHLGAVSTASDVRGLRHLLRALGGSGRPFTVVAQTGGSGEINRALVTALQQSGARVVALGDRPGDITVRASGQVVARGAQDFPVDPVTRQAQRRIDQMNRAIRVVEALPGYSHSPQLGRRQVLDGLRAQVNRLEGLLSRRMELATGELHRRTRVSDAATQLATNGTQLEARQGVEQQLGQDGLRRLARTNPQITALERGLRAARARGEAGRQLRRLIAQVDPQIARQILIEETGRPMSRRQQRRAWRRVRSRLRAQARVESAIRMRAGPAGGGARGVAYFGLFLEAWNLSEPFITQAFRESREASHGDFYTFFRDLVWWNEKGLMPVAVGEAEGREIRSGGALSAGIERRLHEDRPHADEAERGRRLRRLSPEAQGATALQKLYIPALGEWSAGQREAFWTAVLLWVSSHVRNYNDYQQEFEEGLTSVPIRQNPGDSSQAFGSRGWQIRVGVVDDSGHVAARWQSSADLTRIMNAAANRVMRTTGREIERRWSERAAPVATGPAFVAPGSPAPPSRGSQPTRRVRFRSGMGPVYIEMNGEARRLRGFRFWNDSPRFLELGHMSAPSGYVWVTGGDYNTYGAIRSADVWNYAETVRVPREPRTLDVSDPNFMRSREPEEYMSSRQLAAYRLWQQNADGVFVRTLSRSQSTFYRAEVTIYEEGPNRSANLLVRSNDLAPE